MLGKLSVHSGALSAFERLLDGSHCTALKDAYSVLEHCWFLSQECPLLCLGLRTKSDNDLNAHKVYEFSSKYTDHYLTITFVHRPLSFDMLGYRNHELIHKLFASSSTSSIIFGHLPAWLALVESNMSFVLPCLHCLCYL